MCSNDSELIRFHGSCERRSVPLKTKEINGNNTHPHQKEKKSCKNVCWSSLISAQVRTRHIYELWNWSDAGCSHSLFGLHLEGPPGHFPSPFLQLFGIESFRSFLFLVRSGSVSRVTTTPLVYIFPPNITWSYYLTTFFGGGNVMGSVFGIAVFSFGDFIVSSAYFFFFRWWFREKMADRTFLRLLSL